MIKNVFLSKKFKVQLMNFDLFPTYDEEIWGSGKNRGKPEGQGYRK
jgi:hypothetical protein